MIGFKVLFQIIRNRAFFLFALSHIFPAGFLYDVDIADKLAVFTDRHMQRSDLLAVELLKLFNDLTIADIVIVHAGHEEHAREISLFAEFPCLFCTNLYAALAGNHDNSSIRNADSFFHFTDEVKETRCVEKIDLGLLPLNGNYGSRDGEFSLDLFFIVIAYRVAVCYRSHTSRNTGQISHSLCQSRLSGAAMTKQNNVAYSVSSVNVHRYLPKKTIV